MTLNMVMALERALKTISKQNVNQELHALLETAVILAFASKERHGLAPKWLANQIRLVEVTEIVAMGRIVSKVTAKE